ncbi:hypothetical protein FGF1_04660 [Flavobacteriaceae bacterium GF1]
MKRTQFIIPILLLLASCFQEEASTFHEGNLWKITSKNGTESYIFGTVHLYPRSELKLSENAIAILTECSTLALERDVTNTFEQQKFMDFEMPKILTESYKVIISEYGNELVTMENQLIKTAKDNGIRITGLETTDEILRILTNLNEIEIPQANFEKDKMLQAYQQSLKMYKKEQIKSFKDSLIFQMPKRMTKLIVDQRNRNWIDDLVGLVENEPAFIAVGMGHLGGEQGLLQLLAAKGYKPIRMEIKNKPPNTVYN